MTSCGSTTQTEDMSYNTLVLGGGGVKGILELGALHYLYTHDPPILDGSKLATYAGTSVGSMICLLLICGVTPMEIFDEIYKTDKFVGKLQYGNLASWGLFDLNVVMEHVKILMQKMVERETSPLYNYTGDVCDITLEELHERSGKLLRMVTTNVTRLQVEYLDYISTPHLRCIDAVKMSSNVPVVFKRLRYHGCYYVDGGLLDNYPVKCVDVEGAKIYAICVSEFNSAEREGDDELGFIDYVNRIIFLPMWREIQRNREELHASCTQLMIDHSITSLDFGLSQEQKVTAFAVGYTAASNASIERTRADIASMSS